jgi:hypothetical protein
VRLRIPYLDIFDHELDQMPAMRALHGHSAGVLAHAICSRVELDPGRADGYVASLPADRGEVFRYLNARQPIRITTADIIANRWVRDIPCVLEAVEALAAAIERTVIDYGNAVIEELLDDPLPPEDTRLTPRRAAISGRVSYQVDGRWYLPSSVDVAGFVVPALVAHDRGIVLTFPRDLWDEEFDPSSLAAVFANRKFKQNA